MVDEPKAGVPVVAARRWSRRTVVRVTRLVAVVVAVLVVVVVAVTAVVVAAPPSKEDLIRQAGLVGKGELLIGVKEDQPGLAFRDPRTGEYSGFDVDIAYMVASDLGFGRGSVRLLPIQSKDRARMQALDGGRFVTVDLVVASYSITSQRAALPGVSFSAPYLRTAQSVMTRRDHPSVQSLNDLGNEVVCAPTTTTSADSAQRAGLQLVTKNELTGCVDGLLSGQFGAVTTDAAILAGVVHAHPQELKMHALGLDADEQWGINTGSSPALNALVNLSLYHSRYDPQDHRWEDAFERNLRPEQPDSLPQEVANDQQPPVAKVRVREWPWQNQALSPANTSANISAGTSAGVRADGRP
jgi:glutamate transport system substrate-binding protein